MRISRETLMIAAMTLALVAVFCVLDAAYECYFFIRDFRLMLFEEPLTFSDSLWRRVPPHAVFHRLAFATACVVGGGLAAWFVRLSRMSSKLRSRTEERLRRYVENAPYAVILTDVDGNCVDVNPAACRLSGYSPDELMAFKVTDLVSPDALGKAKSLFAKARAGTKTVAELSFRRKDGADRVWSFSAVPMEGGLVLGFAEDITDRQVAEQELTNHRQDLEDEVKRRTRELEKTIDLMAGRELRMRELKTTITDLQRQLAEANVVPSQGDPM